MVSRFSMKIASRGNLHRKKSFVSLDNTIFSVVFFFHYDA